MTGLFFDRKGSLWAGVAFNGIVRLDVKTGGFKLFDLVTAENSPHLTAEDLPNHNIGFRFFQDERGKLWVSTVGDLYVFDPETGAARPWRPMKKLSPDPVFTDQAYSLLPEGELLWTGGWRSGLRRIDRQTGEWRQFMFKPDKTLSFNDNIVSDFIRKGPDEFWIGSKGRGLGIFNKKTEQYYWFAQHPERMVGGSPPILVGELASDNHGNLWAVTEGKLVRFQMKDNPFQFTKVNASTKGNFGISQLLEDREGRFLFIGTHYADGLHVIEKKTGKSQVLKFWAAPTEGGSLLVMDLLQARDGTIWVLTHHTILRYDPDTRQLVTPVQPPHYAEGGVSNFYTEFAEDPLGNLWLGTTSLGVIRYDPNTGQGQQFLPDENDPNSIATNVIGSVEVDGRGRTWFGSRNNTAYGYYLPGERRFEYLDGEGKVTAARATLRMNSFFAAQNGDIWACTEGGILHFDCSGERPRLRKKYTVADGLPGNYFIHGVEDKEGVFWAIAQKLVKIDKATGEITSFGKKDGFNFAANRLNIGPDGNVHIRADNGYFTFDPKALGVEETIVPIALTSFKIDGIECYHGSHLAPAGQLAIPPDSRYFSFEFAALDLAQAEEREYEYRLRGFDNQWVKCQENRSVNYSNIPPGHYTFQVKQAGASDADALNVPLQVQVSFYRTNWFWAIIAALALLAGGRFYQKRRAEERQLGDLMNKAQLLEKEKAVVQYESLKQQLNPHFLFNSLTLLGSLITIDPKAAVGFLDSLSKTYRYILKSSERETVPLSEELKFGESFVKLQKTRFGEGLQVNFKVEEEDLHRKIVPVTLQNLLENAIEHNIIDEDDPLVVSRVC